MDNLQPITVDLDVLYLTMCGFDVELLNVLSDSTLRAMSSDMLEHEEAKDHSDV